MPSFYPDHDPDRENRIAEEILLDTYDVYEEIGAWDAYLCDRVQFPFKAYWGDGDTGEEVEVLGFDTENECDTNIFVEVRYQDGEDGEVLSVLLAEIIPMGGVDDDTQEAIADWQYWIRKGSLNELEEDYG
jgi:hypothetical protein